MIILLIESQWPEINSGTLHEVMKMLHYMHYIHIILARYVYHVPVFFPEAFGADYHRTWAKQKYRGIYKPA